MEEIGWRREDGFVAVVPPSPWPPARFAPAAAAEGLRSALLEGFAEDGDCVVCHLPARGAELVADVVAGVARRVAAWPATVLVAVTPDGHARERWMAAAPRPGLQVVADAQEAAGFVAARPAGQRLRRQLEPLLQAPAIARGLLRRTLDLWGAAELLDDALVVVDELVANAVLHAGTEIELRLSMLGRCLGVAVADRSPRRPALGRPGRGAESGRGLLLVDALADSWHVLPRRDGGKLVRAVLALPAPASPPAPARTAEREVSGQVPR